MKVFQFSGRTRRSRRQTIQLMSLLCSHASDARRVVEIGAGDGDLSRLMQLGGWSVTAVERDLAMRSDLCLHGIVAFSDVRLLTDYDAGFIYCVNDFDAYGDPARLLEVLRRKIVDTGILLLCLPSRSEPLLLRNALAEAGFQLRAQRRIDVLGRASHWIGKVLDVWVPLDPELSWVDMLNTRLDNTPIWLGQAVDAVLGRWLGLELVLIAQSVCGRRDGPHLT